MSSPDYFQHLVMKFFQKRGKLRKETLDALCIAYGDDVMSKSSFYEWYNQCVDGRKECADAPRSDGLVSMHNTTTIEKVELALCDDCRQSLRDIANNTGIN